ncbi:PREDICTED: uncharacterized protein LOC105575075 [Cercocebus atys]|uniref:uncharacterized protein LOC105575075 n=1 Tax=Cercocebus atys TaxID=9531 RepID=UPI0005F44042|nr:PREDICTED: uncharacterized protein LOC105575075 [Cercocebus atys]
MVLSHFVSKQVPHFPYCRIRGDNQRRKGVSGSEPPRRRREAEAQACEVLFRVTSLWAAEGNRRNSASTGHVPLPGAQDTARFLQAAAPASSAPQGSSAQLPHPAGGAEDSAFPERRRVGGAALVAVGSPAGPRPSAWFSRLCKPRLQDSASPSSFLSGDSRGRLSGRRVHISHHDSSAHQVPAPPRWRRHS